MESRAATMAANDRLVIDVSVSADELALIREPATLAYDEARARGWPFLSDVLEAAGRRDAGGEEDRAVLAGAVHALVKYDRLLGFASGSERSDARYGALLALVCGETDLAARLQRIDDATERMGVTYSMPDWLVDRVRAEVGAGSLEAALARMNEAAPRAARVNTLKTSRDACLGALAEEGIPAQPTVHASAGLRLEGRRSPFRTRAFERGELELQDEASQLVAELVAPPPGSFVVDACAGAGGKTLALAALLRGKGKLVAIDASEAKLAELRRRARRAGASNIQAIALDVCDEAALARFAGRASRVLVDAPCTGLGAVRRNPEARWRLRPDDLPRLTAAQGALTRAAARLVAPRGRLVYATCSFLPSEGEAVIDSFLAEHPDFVLVTARDVLGRARTSAVATDDGKYLRTWRPGSPADGGDAGMDGFFAAVVRRISTR
jgi:16S rRNA (cytosine967-C5)-methyltransferase